MTPRHLGTTGNLKQEVGGGCLLLQPRALTGSNEIGTMVNGHTRRERHLVCSESEAQICVMESVAVYVEI